MLSASGPSMLVFHAAKLANGNIFAGSLQGLDADRFVLAGLKHLAANSCAAAMLRCLAMSSWVSFADSFAIVTVAVSASVIRVRRGFFTNFLDSYRV
ncbi:MAG: hypothetical protein IPN53_04850 [Comamonadaceae bacterium]|nr:hypothetical protein [Comamonadaceae bacterium]